MKRRNYSRRLRRWVVAQRRRKTGIYAGGLFDPNSVGQLVRWNGLSPWIDTGFSMFHLDSKREMPKSECKILLYTQQGECKDVIRD